MSEILRKKTKIVQVGNKKIGGNSQISVQSMLSFPSFDFENNIHQAIELEKKGCEILRVAIPDLQTVKLIPLLKKSVGIPIVADIHFDYKLAVESVNAGVDKIRINPGNIGSDENVKKIIDACKIKNIPIRIGINSGSIEKKILAKYGGPTSDAMCESALKNVELLEKYNFNNIVISVKSSDILETVDAYRKLSIMTDYPLHIGITEAGTKKIGSIKSAIGIGSLLLDGIGDTIRVTLTDDPICEVEAGINILRSLGLRSDGIKIISCPTCGRTRINVIEITKKLENLLKNSKKNCKIAVMGCAVNGPDEARSSDIGIAGGDGFGIIFKRGRLLRKVPEQKLLDELILELENI